MQLWAAPAEESELPSQESCIGPAACSTKAPTSTASTRSSKGGVPQTQLVGQPYPTARSSGHDSTGSGQARDCQVPRGAQPQPEQMPLLRQLAAQNGSAVMLKDKHGAERAWLAQPGHSFAAENPSALWAANADLTTMPPAAVLTERARSLLRHSTRHTRAGCVLAAHPGRVGHKAAAQCGGRGGGGRPSLAAGRAGGSARPSSVSDQAQVDSVPPVPCGNRHTSCRLWLRASGGRDPAHNSR